MKTIIMIIIATLLLGCNVEEEIRDIYNNHESETVFVSDDGRVKVVVMGDTIGDVDMAHAFYSRQIDDFAEAVNGVYINSPK